MKMAVKDGQLLIIEADPTQESVIKSWGKMKWNRQARMLVGTPDLETLTLLSKLVRLPASIEATRFHLQQVQDAVDAERSAPHPKPLVNYPVTKTLYEHQVRAANMALLTFGIAEAEAYETPEK